MFRLLKTSFYPVASHFGHLEISIFICFMFSSICSLHHDVYVMYCR